MTTVSWVAIGLGAVLLNVILAYVPLVLIVAYNLRPKKPSDPLHAYVVEDAIATEEYVKLIEEEWRKKRHAPLT